MCPRLVSRRVVREQSSQSDRLVAKLLTNQLLASRSLVALVEKQIERLQNPLQPTRQFFASRVSSGSLPRKTLARRTTSSAMFLDTLMIQAEGFFGIP